MYISCSKCDALVPVWEELAATLKEADKNQEQIAKYKPGVVIARADCTLENELCIGKPLRH